MILRAIFWIAIVAMFMPHGPDLGLDRSDAGTRATLPTTLASWAGGAAQAPQKACLDHPQDCAKALGIVDMLQDVAVRSLSQVKAEIEASQRERARRAGGD